jgi:hypothetical protein
MLPALDISLELDSANIGRFVFPVVMSVGFLLVFVMTLLRYLGGSRRDRDEVWHTLERQQLRMQLEELKSNFASRAALTEVEREEIKTKTTAMLKADIQEAVVGEIEKRLRENPAEDPHVTSIRMLSKEMQSRLLFEVEALGLRANVNLAFGVGISFVGLGALSYFVYVTGREMATAEDMGVVAMRFGIRLSLVVFMQIFAFFFLRLYRYSLFEIKYFQNEITGSQFRLMALETALMLKDKGVLDRLIAGMSKIERNIILRKGEVSLAAERDKIESEYDKSLLGLLERAVGSRGKQPEEAK